MATCDGGVEPPVFAFAAHRGDLVEVAAHHEETPRPGQADVQVAAGLVADPVDGQDDDRPLEPLEAEDMAVERVAASEERVPVAVPAVVAEHLHLDLMAPARHEKSKLP